jgi:soluble lytic murein transglycosylase-like protein
MKQFFVVGLALSQIMTIAQPAAAAQESLLQKTLRLEQKLKSPDRQAAETALFNLLRREEKSVLKPFWLYLLAGTNPSQDDPRNYLHGQKSLSAAYYAWKIVQTPASFCSRDWSILARLLPSSPTLPMISDSKLLQKRLHCSQGLDARERLNLAKWLNAQKFFWLVPPLLKTTPSPEHIFEKAQAFYAEQKYAQAYPLLVNLLKLPSSQIKVKRSQLLLQAGICQAHLGSTKTALQWWHQISQQDLDYYPEMLWQKTLLAQRKGKIAEKEHTLKTLTQQYPKHARTAEALGLLLRQKLNPFQPSALLPIAERILQYHPATEEAAAARYWQARILSFQDKQNPLIRQRYEELTQGPINVYYTHLAICRLKGTNCFKNLATELRHQAPDLSIFQQEPILKEAAENNHSQLLAIIAPFISRSEAEIALLHSYADLKNGDYFHSIRRLWQIPSRNPEVLRLIYPLHYQSIMKKFSNKYQLPLTLVTGLAWQESMYKADIRSSAGAIGLMQLMPGTAREIAPKAGISKLSVGQLTQPEINIHLGSFYLREQLNRWQGELIPTIAAYNAGPNAVGRWRQNFGKLSNNESLHEELFIEHIPYEETRRYVKQVFTHAWVYAWLYASNR